MQSGISSKSDSGATFSLHLICIFITTTMLREVFKVLGIEPQSYTTLVFFFLWIGWFNSFLHRYFLLHLSILPYRTSDTLSPDKQCTRSIFALPFFQLTAANRALQILSWLVCIKHCHFYFSNITLLVTGYRGVPAEW